MLLWLGPIFRHATRRSPQILPETPFRVGSPVSHRKHSLTTCSTRNSPCHPCTKIVQLQKTNPCPPSEGRQSLFDN